MGLAKTAYTLIICIASVFILIYLESILIPFVFAVIIWFLIKEFRNISNKIALVNRLFPNWLLNLVAFVIIFGLITVFSKILSSNISQLMNELPKYQANISKLIRQGNAVLGMDILNEMHLAIESYDFTSILKKLFNSLSGVLGNIFLVILYVFFLLLEEEYLSSKLRGIFPINEQFQSSRELFQEIDKSIGSYIVLKTVISLITGILSYTALLLIGVDFPIFWAILIFLLKMMLNDI